MAVKLSRDSKKKKKQTYILRKKASNLLKVSIIPLIKIQT